ncbi:uncharacterized protein LOC144095035 [Amblyomma americanum]
MFPDSEIAKGFSCGERKCAYITCHGLRPFFLSSLQRAIEWCENYVVLFDESANECLQEKQMDVHIRFWDSSRKVVTKYYTSVFMGHATAEDIKDELLSALEPLPLAKILQISMDRPNVNLKFFKMLQSHLQQNFQVHCLDLGTCSLHTVYNAYKAGVIASKWGLDTLLSSLSALFEDAPARRHDFSALTGKAVFPLKYVAHRWVENVAVIERAPELWSDVKKFVESARKKQVSLRKCVSFQNIVEFIQDTLVVAKLNFALSVAATLKPFLMEFQTDKPMLFLLARDLETIVRKLMTKFIKCSTLSSATGITGMLQIDIEDPKNHTPLEKVDVGHTVEQILKKCNASAKDIFQFKMECKQFLVAVTKKVLEKSPLRFTVVRGLSSLDPRQMCCRPNECLAGLKKVLEALIAAGRLTDQRRDSVLAEYTELLHEKHQLRLFEKATSLDTFFSELMQFNASYAELWKVVKSLLVLSHGQATVERGFSINRQISVENLKGLFYISQRIVCDAVEKAGGIFNIVIIKDLRKAVSAARHHYSAYLEAQKRLEQECVKQSKKRCAEAQLDSFNKKRKILEAAVSDLTASADDCAEKAEAANDLTYIIKSNYMRKAAKAKAEQLLNLNKEIEAKLQEVS